MSNENFPRRGSRKVVEADELQLATESGWTLLESFDEVQAESCFGQEPRQVPDTSSGYVNDTVSTQRFMSVTTRKFLLGMEEDCILAVKAAEIATLEADISALRETMTEVETLKDKFEGEFNKVKKILDQQQDCLDKERETNRILDKKCRRMEEDLGKLRVAIGDLQFKEILDP